MDLLQLDLTDEHVLREKIYTKKKTVKTEPLDGTDEPVIDAVSRDSKIGSKPLTAKKDKQINSIARERQVPATRLSRVASFANLGVGLVVGTVAEASRRVVTRGGPKSGAATDSSLVLNPANASRIVSTLCRVRGAALKLGQILSIQDGAVISPELQRIFDRVREAADYMPEWQLEEVMVKDLGESWRSQFSEFTMAPIAAASIGQVHHAILQDGTEVAVKVQYPGVAASIESDIRNLLSSVSVLAMLPEGLFIDKIAQHMKVELAQECDYKREAACGVKMRHLLAKYPEFKVPKVYHEQSGGQVLTTEFLHGLTIDECIALPQETRNFIASSVLKLVFTELFLNRYMQTDPNWANFLYSESTGQLGLIDFGATREFRPFFVNTYYKIINCAVNKDREGVLIHSREIGFLTGAESKIMNDAHVDSVMLLAKPFHDNSNFDFGNQKITHEIQELSTVMLRERLCPPPPEVYSLHRKLSGLFLLAGKLESAFNCYLIW